MTPLFSTEAREDLVAAVRYYEDRQRSLGERFESEVYEAARRIAAAPESWPRIDADARFYRVDPFPYALIYFIDETSRVVIVAVFELHHDPDKLAKLLSES